ncbi:MAG: ATP-dependent Clp protease adaptor ClpS [Bacteroidales bacterium]|jgi:ATP-dependent Clp protease adaptor protein ClpS|nr:ATP-dependent Clp protease adaptor ClpS [Bacteroidales bacterium]
MSNTNNTQGLPGENSCTIEKKSDNYTMLLYNDDYNTFDHVIDCLVSVCDHDSIQAEQCAYIVHYTGKCDIKQGSFSELKPMKEKLIESGLSVVLEK